MSETRYSVYVITLSQDVLGEHKFRKVNPLYVEGQPCVYVGSTACTPDERFQQHKHGYKHNRYAKDYGVEPLSVARSEPSLCTTPYRITGSSTFFLKNPPPKGGASLSCRLGHGRHLTRCYR